MINAKMISMSNDTYYTNVEILEQEDYIKYGVKKHFGIYTIAFYAEGHLYTSHAFNVRMIEIEPIKLTVPCTHYSRIIISDNISYQDVSFLDDHLLKLTSIPIIYQEPIEQVAFKTQDKMFILSAMYIICLLKNDNRGGTDKIIPRSKHIISNDLPNTPGIIRILRGD